MIRKMYEVILLVLFTRGATGFYLNGYMSTQEPTQPFYTNLFQTVSGLYYGYSSMVSEFFGIKEEPKTYFQSASDAIQSILGRKKRSNLETLRDEYIEKMDVIIEAVRTRVFRLPERRNRIVEFVEKNGMFLVGCVLIVIRLVNTYMDKYHGEKTERRVEVATQTTPAPLTIDQTRKTNLPMVHIRTRPKRKRLLRSRLQTKVRDVGYEPIETISPQPSDEEENDSQSSFEQIRAWRASRKAQRTAQRLIKELLD